MSRIFSTGRDENLENTLGQPLVDLEKVASKLGKKSMVRTASNKQTRKAGSNEEQQITALVDKILNSKQQQQQVEDVSGCNAGECMDMEPEACGTVAVRPRSAKTSIENFGVKNGQFIMPTAEYLERCAEEGDEESYLKALEIRSKAIEVFVKKSAADELRRVEAAKEARENWRQVVSENLEEEKDDDEKDEKKDEWQKPWEKEDDEKEEKEEKKSKKASKKSMAFKAASKLEDSEREILAKKLVGLGYSKEAARNYIETALAPKYQVPEYISMLAASPIEKSAKTEIFKGFVREASLEEKDRSHLLDYWSNILGYQDKDWCSDLVKDVDPVTGE
jgi:hypothetical protein